MNLGERQILLLDLAVEFSAGVTSDAEVERRWQDMSLTHRRIRIASPEPLAPKATVSIIRHSGKNWADVSLFDESGRPIDTFGMGVYDDDPHGTGIGTVAEQIADELRLQGWTVQGDEVHEGDAVTRTVEPS